MTLFLIMLLQQRLMTGDKAFRIYERAVNELKI